jgi:AbrB family looped-hinge helix DNA binding protein
VNTKLSTKGQVVLPSSIREKLGLQAGDHLEAEVRGGRVILTPRKRRKQKARILTDHLTGLPVLSVGPEAPSLTNKQVRETLAEFP